MRLIFALFALIALAACERAKEEGAPPAAPAIEVREVAAADGYGEPGDVVNAVAFWSHPSVNFESRIIAATNDGLKAINIESGDSAGSAGGSASSVAVFYLGDGARAQGYAIVGGAGAYSLYAIANDAPSLTSVAITGAPLAADAFCARGGVVYEAGNNQLDMREISIKSGGAVIGEARKIADVQGVAACHVDDRSGEVLTLGRDGAIRRVDPETGESFGLAFVNSEAATASALFLMTTPEPESAPGGAVAVLDGNSGVISLFDLVDGRALGAVRIKSTFDLDAVATAKTFAAGYGNYGGVYRDGALAVVTDGDGPPIRLAPWNGVLDALKLPLGENVDPRAPQPEETDDGVLSIELEHP